MRELAVRLRCESNATVYTVNEDHLKSLIYAGRSRVLKLVRLALLRRHVNFLRHDLGDLRRFGKRFIFHDQTILGQFVLRSFWPVSLVEDGVSTYHPKRFGIERRIKTLGGVFAPGYDPRIRRIYLYHPERYAGLSFWKVRPIPARAPQARGVDTDELLKSLFRLQSSLRTLETCSDAKRIQVVLTQPLSQVGLVSRTEHEEFYRCFVNQLPRPVLLKRHPQDDVIYPFEHDGEIEGCLPYELLTEVLPADRVSFWTMFTSTTGVNANVVVHSLTTATESQSSKRRIIKSVISGESIAAYSDAKNS